MTESGPNQPGHQIDGVEVQGSPVWQALAGHQRSFPLAVVLPPPARGPGRRVEEGLSRSLSGGGGKPSFPSPSAGDLRELPGVKRPESRDFPG